MQSYLENLSLIQYMLVILLDLPSSFTILVYFWFLVISHVFFFPFRDFLPDFVPPEEDLKISVCYSFSILTLISLRT